MISPKPNRGSDPARDDDDGPSATQLWWKETAEEFREALRRRIAQVPAFTHAENYQLALALNQAFWFDINATTYDEKLEAAARGEDD